MAGVIPGGLTTVPHESLLKRGKERNLGRVWQRLSGHIKIYKASFMPGNVNDGKSISGCCLFNDGKGQVFELAFFKSRSSVEGALSLKSSIQKPLQIL